MDYLYKKFTNIIQTKNSKHWSFNDLISDMLNNKRVDSVVTGLFVKSRQLKISPAFTTQSYFTVPKNIWSNSTHYFTIKIPNK